MGKHFTQKYLEAFAFSAFVPTDKCNRFLYQYEKDGKKGLHLFDYLTHKSLEETSSLIDIDFNKQSCIPLKLIGDRLYLLSDSKNMENYNVFVLDIKSKEIKQVTNNSYTSCVRISDEEVLYYSAREKNEKGLFKNKIYIHDLNSGESTFVTDDDGELYRVGWGAITPSMNRDFLLLNVDRNNERTNQNLLFLNLHSKKKFKLLPDEYESSRFYLLEEEINTDEGFYFISDCSDYDNLYYFDFKTYFVTKLTDIQYMTDGFSILQSEGNRYFVHNQILPGQGITKVMLHKELEVGVLLQKQLCELRYEGNIVLSSKKSDFLWIGNSNLSQLSRRDLYLLRDDELHCVKSIEMIKKTQEELIHSTHQFISISSYDGLEIPSYLVIPKGEIKGAVITAFYGGSNSYSIFYQILAELGFMSLSPAVRGSWGYGKEWEKMLKGDLGGSEILDLIWAARYLENQYNLKPEQIGIEGGSHGGYSTLRALTLPASFKDQDSKYPFGFGICWAGFADLVDFYKKSNIPDWLANMLGPYEENKNLYLDRSPVNHFEELNTPLFITHGTQDNRVPASTMEGFLFKLQNSEVPHCVYMMKGQGHTGGSIEERVDEFKTMFEFLENVTKLGWTF